MDPDARLNEVYEDGWVSRRLVAEPGEPAPAAFPLRRESRWDRRSVAPQGMIVRITPTMHAARTEFGPETATIMGRKCLMWTGVARFDYLRTRTEPDHRMSTFELGLADDGDIIIRFRDNVVLNRNPVTGGILRRSWRDSPTGRTIIWIDTITGQDCTISITTRPYGITSSAGGPVPGRSDTDQGTSDLVHPVAGAFRGTRADGSVSFGAGLEIRVLGRTAVLHPSDAHVHVWGGNAVFVQSFGIFSATNWLPGLGAILIPDAEIASLFIALWARRSGPSPVRLLPRRTLDDLLVRLCRQGHTALTV